MESKELNEKTERLWAELQIRIGALQSEKKNSLEFAQFALSETDTAIRTLKSWILPHDFDCWEREAAFFKKLKPPFIAKFIYYSKIITLLSSLPHACNKTKKNIYEKELDYLHYFSLENKDFISYYRRSATYLDKKYFLRFSYDLDVKLAADIHSYDERFSTSHDHLISQIIAHEEYEMFLHQQILKLKEAVPAEPSAKRVLQWTGSKVGLTELVFALHHTHCFNGGNSSLAETVKWFEESFGIQLGNYHNTIGEIRNRKTPHPKFLGLLADNFMAYLEKDDATSSP